MSVRPSVRPQVYTVRIHGVQRDLPEHAVLWWVRGVADQRAEAHVLDQLADTAPDETNRMRALMLAEQNGWLEYIGVADDPAEATA